MDHLSEKDPSCLLLSDQDEHGHFQILSALHQRHPSDKALLLQGMARLHTPKQILLCEPCERLLNTFQDQLLRKP